MLRVGSAVVAGVLLATLSACDQRQSANSLCENALGRKVGSELPTTLGEIRRTGTGLAGDYPAGDAFGDAPDSAPGAWCWVYRKPGRVWAPYGVDANGTAVIFPKLYVGPPDDPPTSPPFYA